MVSLLVAFALIFAGPVLIFLGQWLILNEESAKSDAVVVLSTGVEYYPRLMEAADLHKKGLAKKVVINGNRKTHELRALEARGFEPCCPWHEDSIRILGVLGVPRSDIVAVSAENAYDTVSEAQAVGNELIRWGYRSIIITTSKFHTRRAVFIWRKLFKDKLVVGAAAAAQDPYDPEDWWKHGRQIRWVLSEYGAWIYYWWKNVLGIS